MKKIKTTKEHRISESYYSGFSDEFRVYDKNNLKWKSRFGRPSRMTREFNIFEHPLLLDNQIEDFLQPIETDWGNWRKDLFERVKDKKYYLNSEEKRINSRMIWTLLHRSKSEMEDSKRKIDALVDIVNIMNETDIQFETNLWNLNKIMDPEGPKILEEKFLWAIVINNSDYEFFVSDNPVNRVNHPIDENLQFFMPVFPRIGIWTIEKEGPMIFNNDMERTIKFNSYKDIEFFNALQIRNAFDYVYVYSKDQEELLEELLESDLDLLDKFRTDVKIDGNSVF